MNWLGRLPRLRAAVLVGLVPGSLSGCADDDGVPSGTGGSAAAHGGRAAGGGSSGEAGDANTARGGSGGNAGNGGNAGGVINEGGSGGDVGGEAGTGNVGGHQPPPGGVCNDDAECDDGLYCNGVEVCRKASPNSQVKLCLRPQFGPCGGNACDEVTRCDCSVPDADGDGVPMQACAKNGQPYDCDDTDKTRYPRNAEVCDLGSEQSASATSMHDEDCRDDTYVSAGRVNDVDSDNFFDSRCGNYAYYQPFVDPPPTPLLASVGADCDDSDTPSGRASNPNAREICDFKDNDCNGIVDDASGAEGELHTYYVDHDHDQFGDKDAQPLKTLCATPPPGYALLSGDCKDDDIEVWPGQTETCNGKDDDCDGTTDQPLAAGTLLADEPYQPPTEFECTGAPGWKVTQCPADRLDCDLKYQNACETIGTTLCNCHACGNVCAFSCGESGCEEIRSIATGRLHTCALVQAAPAGAGAASGSVACWGTNVFGQLGDGTTKSSLSPLLIKDFVGVSAVSAGFTFSCAIAQGDIYCWGRNNVGQLGANSSAQTATSPTPVVLDPAWGKASRLSSGSDFSCAIYGSGALACWGNANMGQLGNGEDGDGALDPAPVRVVRDNAGTQEYVNDAILVAAGQYHACAYSPHGVECWGDNSAGQLGVSPTALDHSPVARRVPGLDGLQVDELVAAGLHTCARAGSAVYCWGSNSSGEVAQDPAVEWSLPTRIQLPSDVSAIAAGRYFGCALSGDHSLWCWGSNDHGERGSAETLPFAPTKVPLSSVSSVFGGNGMHVCATNASARAFCWGLDDEGQLGNGARSDLMQPTPLAVLPLGGTRGCAQ